MIAGAAHLSNELHRIAIDVGDAPGTDVRRIAWRTVDALSVGRRVAALPLAFPTSEHMLLDDA
jgi:hypothetical protein